MLKRLLIYCLVLFFMASLLFTLHLYYQPQPAPIVLLDYGRGLSFDYDDIQDYVSRREGNHYLWFCDGGVDCKFVNDNMLRPLVNQVKEEDFMDLVFVDMSNLRQDVSPSRLLSDWGFSTYPAFVSITIEENQKTINHVLQWSFSDPFTQADIKQWMIDNEIWNGPIDLPTGE